MAAPWVSSQVGINGQFFVPRLLWSMHRLERMLVPLWYDAASPAYWMLGRLYWNAPNFFHPDLARAPIRSFLKEKILSELILRRVRRGATPGGSRRRRMRGSRRPSSAI